MHKIECILKPDIGDDIEFEMEISTDELKRHLLGTEVGKPVSNEVKPTKKITFETVGKNWQKDVERRLEAIEEFTKKAVTVGVHPETGEKHFSYSGEK